MLSGRVNENSKILYDRNPRQMVEKVAPWLTVDQDPFPAVVDGKVVWMLDGYTTTDQYPLSQRASFEEMTSDALDSGNEFRTLPTDEINYMRNAVKATVDAYDGTVTLYAWDEGDPLLKAWRDAFPGTRQGQGRDPRRTCSSTCATPRTCSRCSATSWRATTSPTPSDFYENNDRWEVAKDPEATGKLQPPYRLSVRTPQRVGGAGVLADVGLHAVPAHNLASFVAVDADASNDGLRHAAGAAAAGNDADPGSGPDRQRVRLEPTIQNELASS